MLAKKLFWCQMRHFQRGKWVFSKPFFSSKTRQKSEKQIPGKRAQVMFERARTFLQREKWVFSNHLLTSQSKQKTEKLKQKSNQTFSKWKLLRVCNWQEKITIIRHIEKFKTLWFLRFFVTICAMAFVCRYVQTFWPPRCEKWNYSEPICPFVYDKTLKLPFFYTSQMFCCFSGNIHWTFTLVCFRTNKML